jgi:hypothetical protein
LAIKAKETMSGTQPAHIAISYHTATDLPNIMVLADALLRVGVIPEKLDYLTVSGFGSKEGLGGGALRTDAWIEHFTDILERSVGMIVVQGEHTRASQEMGGMWIESRLALQCADSDHEYVRIIGAPSLVVGVESEGPSTWAISIVETLRPWIEQRSRSGRVGLIKRFPSDTYNLDQSYDIYEIQFAGKQRVWFYISVMDLYDRAWHCRRCLAASDVWSYPNSRPR